MYFYTMGNEIRAKRDEYRNLPRNWMLSMSGRKIDLVDSDLKGNDDGPFAKQCCRRNQC